MGWYFTKGATKVAIIAQITKDEPRQPAYNWSNAEQKSAPTGYDFSQKTLRQCVRGNVLWTVEETVRYKEPVERDRFIGCYLLETRRGEAGYKPMDESMGPYYYSCPLSYLDMVPEANTAWRQNVRAYHVEKTQQNSPPQQSPAETQPAKPEATITPEGSANGPDPVRTDCKPIISKGEDSRMPVTLKFKWTISRARDTYGWNVCTLYADGKKVARCNGGGYDMEGTVLGDWIAKRFAEHLCERITTPMDGLSFHDPDFDPARARVPNTNETVEAREAAGKSLGLERYQAVVSASSPVPTPNHRLPYLDGAYGKKCMIEVLKAIGGTFKEIDGDKNHSIAIVSAPPQPTDRDREAALPSEAAVAPESTTDPERDSPTTRPEGRESQEREPGSKKPQKMESGVMRAFIWDYGSDREASVTFARIYKSQKTGEWAYSSSLRERDLNDLNKLVREVARVLDHTREQEASHAAVKKRHAKDQDRER